MENTEAKKYKLYHYALTIPNSSLTLTAIPATVDNAYKVISGICYRAAEKIQPIFTAFKKGNAYDDTDSSFISFTIPYPKTKIVAIVEEVLTMMEHYSYTTTDLDANYTNRHALLTVSILKEMLYVIKHSKYSTSYTTKKIDYSSSYRWSGYPEVSKSVYEPVDIEEDSETRPVRMYDED